jgi:integrase
MNPSPIVKTVKRGALFIHIRQYDDGRYGFDYKPDDHSRSKVRLKDVGSAIGRAEELIGLGHAGKASLLSINPEELAEFLRWRAAQRKSPSIPEIVDAFMATKEELEARQELSEKHVRDLRGTLKKFAERFTMRIDQVERSTVEDWLNDQDTGPRRFNNMRTHLVALVHFARDHNWLSMDKHPIEKIPRRKVKARKETYTPDELKRILKAVPLEWLPAVVLGAFAGIRPEEVCPDPRSHKPPLRWENIKWAKGHVEILPEVAKDGRKRWAPLGEAAVAFLAGWKNARGRIVPAVRMSDLTATWARLAGLPQNKWRFDALRHSFASYRLAIIEDIPKLTLEMGNSAKMVHDHYLDLKTEAEAIEYFAIRPEHIRLELLPANVVQFA